MIDTRAVNSLTKDVMNDTLITLKKYALSTRDPEKRLWAQATIASLLAMADLTRELQALAEGMQVA